MTSYDFGAVASNLLWAVLFGALGGLGLQFLQEKGLELPHVHQEDGVTFWNFGLIAPILVGALAALITYALDPPGNGDTLHFIGLTLVAGVGGQAILKSYLNGKVADQEANRAESLRAGVEAVQVQLRASTSRDTSAASADAASRTALPGVSGAASQLESLLQADTRLQQRMQRYR